MRNGIMNYLQSVHGLPEGVKQMGTVRIIVECEGISAEEVGRKLKDLGNKLQEVINELDMGKLEDMIGDLRRGVWAAEERYEEEEV